MTGGLKKQSKSKEAVTSSSQLKLPNEDFRPLFENLFEEASYERLNPFACIPAVQMRPIVRSGVLNLKALFRKGYSHADDICSTGIVMGTDTPIVVPLIGLLQHFVVDCFKKKRATEEELETAVSRHDKWFGIIDGVYSNDAIRELVDEDPEWKNFKWFVTVLHGEHIVEKCRKLARAQNSRHSGRYFIEMTLYDELNNLRAEYENI